MYCNNVKMEWGKTIFFLKKSHEIDTALQFCKNGFKGVITNLCEKSRIILTLIHVLGNCL